jgi:hypothetical protein
LRKNDLEFEATLGKVSENLSQKQNRKLKRRWRCGSNGRVLTQSPGFNTNTQYLKKVGWRVDLSIFLYA